MMMMMMMAVGYLSAVCCFLVLAVMELKLGPKSAVKIVFLLLNFP